MWKCSKANCSKHQVANPASFRSKQVCAKTRLERILELQHCHCIAVRSYSSSKTSIFPAITHHHDQYCGATDFPSPSSFEYSAVRTGLSPFERPPISHLSCVWARGTFSCARTSYTDQARHGSRTRGFEGAFILRSKHTSAG
jgi:hypothetical protein